MAITMTRPTWANERCTVTVRPAPLSFWLLSSSFGPGCWRLSHLTLCSSHSGPCNVVSHPLSRREPCQGPGPGTIAYPVHPPWFLSQPLGLVGLLLEDPPSHPARSPHLRREKARSSTCSRSRPCCPTRPPLLARCYASSCCQSSPPIWQVFRWEGPL